LWRTLSACGATIRGGIESVANGCDRSDPFDFGFRLAAAPLLTAPASRAAPLMPTAIAAATTLLAVIAVGGCVYLILAIIAANRFRGGEPPPAAKLPPISVLKPLAGLDAGLEENLRSFFELDYPGFELLFAVREETDPAVRLVRKLQAKYPDIDSRLLVAGPPPSEAQYPNAKVWSLIALQRLSSHPIIVISDSDIRAAPSQLHAVGADFADPAVGVVTYPYRAVPGGGLWSLLESIGMNGEFWAGILVARMIEGMNFAVGPTMALRREALEKVGGFEATREYLAEDFVLGRWISGQGCRAVLSHHVVEHRIAGGSFAENMRHRLRWYRSTRRSRPAGYVGQVFTNPIPVALLLAAMTGGANWAVGVLAAAFVLRCMMQFAVARGVLGDRHAFGALPLVPVQDIASFAIWVAAFFGKTIVWRGRVFELLRDGRLRLRDNNQH